MLAWLKLFRWLDSLVKVIILARSRLLQEYLHSSSDGTIVCDHFLAIILDSKHVVQVCLPKLSLGFVCFSMSVSITSQKQITDVLPTTRIVLNVKMAAVI